MAHKVVIRVEKLKSIQNVAASLSHTYCTRETPNAASERLAENEHSHADAQGLMQAFRERLPEKRRKDAVLCLEYVVTAHQDWFKGKSRAEQDAYLHDGLAWLKQRHGVDNVAGWAIHRDELAPHLVAYVVPLDEAGKLNAKRFTGGRKVLSQLQTDFAREVGVPHGLERGIEGSRATHQTVKEYYARANEPTPELQPIEVPEPGLKDRLNPSDYGRRVAQSVVDQMQPERRALLAKVREQEAAQERAKQVQATAQELAKKKREAESNLQRLAEPMRPFMRLAVEDRQGFDELRTQAMKRLAMMEQKAEQKRRIEALRALESSSGGAAYTFAKNALAAIQEAGGDAGKVDWNKVEQQSFNEAVQQHGQGRIEAVQALIKHSPGAVRPERKRGLEATIEKFKTQGHKPHETARGKDRGPELSR